MTRIRIVWYWKRYMRKGRYRCKRYLLYLPVAIGDQVDRSVDYVVRLFGPAIVLVPKGVEFPFINGEEYAQINTGDSGSANAQATLPATSDFVIEVWAHNMLPLPDDFHANIVLLPES